MAIEAPENGDDHDGLLLEANYLVSVEGFMFYVSDADRDADMTQVWMSYRKEDLIGNLGDFVTVGTRRCGDCPVHIKLYQSQPPADIDADADHVTECTVQFPTGGINISGTLCESFDGTASFSVDRDTAYTMHVVHTGLRTVALDRLTGNDLYVVHLWPAAADVQGRGTTVLRRFDPFSSMEGMPYFTMPVASEKDTKKESEEEGEVVFKGLFHVKVDSFMLFLADAGSEVDVAKVWLSYSQHDRLGAQDTCVAVGTARCGDCRVAVTVLSSPPRAPLVIEQADHVTECTVQFPTGDVCITGTLSEGFDGTASFSVDRDTAYTMHVVHTGLRTVAPDRLSGDDLYSVCMWPVAAGHNATPTVRVRYQP